MFWPSAIQEYDPLENKSADRAPHRLPLALDSQSRQQQYAEAEAMSATDIYFFVLAAHNRNLKIL